MPEGIAAQLRDVQRLLREGRPTEADIQLNTLQTELERQAQIEQMKTVADVKLDLAQLQMQWADVVMDLLGNPPRLTAIMVEIKGFGPKPNQTVMPNLYGVANPLPSPVYGTCIGSADVACPAATETNCIALPVNQPISQGIYYPCVTGTLFVSLGATPATALTYNARIGAGADFAGNQCNALLLIASATVELPFTFLGFGTVLPYPTGPLTFNITLNPTAQAVTCRFIGSFSYGYWMRAPDQ